MEDGGHVTELPWKAHSWQFWCLFGALCLTSFIGSIDATVVTTALPTITREIGRREEQYVWIANSFILASTMVGLHEHALRTLLLCLRSKSFSESFLRA